MTLYSFWKNLLLHLHSVAFTLCCIYTLLQSTLLQSTPLHLLHYIQTCCIQLCAVLKHLKTVLKCICLLSVRESRVYAFTKYLKSAISCALTYTHNVTHTRSIHTMSHIQDLGRLFHLDGPTTERL